LEKGGERGTDFQYSGSRRKRLRPKEKKKKKNGAVPCPLFGSWCEKIPSRGKLINYFGVLFLTRGRKAENSLI